jgi:glutathione S-transferase
MDGSGDYREIHSLGSVPALMTEEGQLITESAAILQYIADRFPTSSLVPRAGMKRVQLQQWLSFISTELHVRFSVLLRPLAPAGAKEHARQELQPRLAFVNEHLTGRDYLLDRFSIADALLFVVLLWTNATAIDLTQYPALALYIARIRENPSVERALAEEFPMYAEDEAAARQAVGAK